MEKKTPIKPEFIRPSSQELQEQKQKLNKVNVSPHTMDAFEKKPETKQKIEIEIKPKDIEFKPKQKNKSENPKKIETQLRKVILELSKSPKDKDKLELAEQLRGKRSKNQPYKEPKNLISDAEKLVGEVGKEIEDYKKPKEQKVTFWSALRDTAEEFFGPEKTEDQKNQEEEEIKRRKENNLLTRIEDTKDVQNKLIDSLVEKNDPGTLQQLGELTGLVSKLEETTKQVRKEVVHKVFKGNQSSSDIKESGRLDESFSVKEAEELVESRLNRDMQNNPVKFEKSKVSDQVNGKCTAMSLALIKSYFKIEESLSDKGKTKDAETLTNELSGLKIKHSRASRKVRTQQAAFDTIQVSKEAKDIDHSKSKIQALVNFNQFKIDYSSKEMDMNNINRSEFNDEVKKLPKGVYLLRTIDPTENEKMEVQGHSMVFIKENDFGYFYDPNFGLDYLPKTEYENTLHGSLKFCAKTWNVTQARFYRLTPPTKTITESNVENSPSKKEENTEAELTTFPRLINEQQISIKITLK